MNPDGEAQEHVLDRVPLRFLVGPTASGKTGLGLRVAAELGAEIIALDSMTVYRGLDIGTAKPTLEERAQVPHHLIDVADPERRFDLQSYLGMVEEALLGLESRGSSALFVGGTGLYLAAMLRGVFDGPPADPELRALLTERAEREGDAALHAELAAVDPESAERIHVNDRRRTVRALEVWQQTGQTMSAHQSQWSDGPSPREARAVIVGLELPTEELDRRIRLRTDEMLRAGWPEEAARVLSGRGLGPSASQALGYKAAAAVGTGELSQAEGLDEIALRTRQFARRQRTWFRKFDIDWVDPRSEAASNAITARMRSAR
ncbi:tRNA (adenosine(37)-N6)-dimethylallyltransferase MiaA [Planctomycetota bacterium]|nr:tRNA (adenosine(37)-N6)-dimethylallyltransferase MiaA [Planctomycetota bacterium]